MQVERRAFNGLRTTPDSPGLKLSNERLLKRVKKKNAVKTQNGISSIFGKEEKTRAERDDARKVTENVG